MLKTLPLLLFSAIACHAQDEPGRVSKLLLASDAVLVATDIGDLLSSRGLNETNPILGRGQFGSLQVTINLGLTAAIVLIEIPIARRWPRLAKVFAITNIGAGAATHGYEMYHNVRQ